MWSRARSVVVAANADPPKRTAGRTKERAPPGQET